MKKYQGLFMAKSCPISLYRVDTNIVRFISLQVSIISILFIVSSSPIFALILVYDFSIRSFRITKCSPFFLFAKAASDHFCTKPHMVDEAPKRFALFIGLAFSIVMFLLSIVGWNTAADVAAGILLVCAVLETLFDYCVGCKIYQIIQSLKKIGN